MPRPGISNHTIVTPYERLPNDGRIAGQLLAGAPIESDPAIKPFFSGSDAARGA
jgi:hypothetical protein